MVKKRESTPKLAPNQNTRLDKRISELETQVKYAEERARYAETEAQLRKRIADAQKKIADNTPPGMFSSLVPGLASKRPKGKGVKVLLVLVGIVVLIIVAEKTCGM